MKTPEPEPTYTVSEFMARHQVNRTTVLEWARAGRVKAERHISPGGQRATILIKQHDRPALVARK